MDNYQHSLNQHQPKSEAWIFSLAIGIIGLAGLAIVSRYNFLLFHGFAELFSISVAWAVFFLVWNTRHVTDADSLVFIGIAYFFIGLVDLLHTLAYKGMGVFSSHWGANLPTQLWILARYMESVSLILFPTLFQKKSRPALMFACWAGATGLLLSTIFYWQVFPDCYIEGVGLTRFKIISEYLICILLSMAFVFLYLRKDMIDAVVFKLLAVSILMTICAELAFTFYVSVYGFSNLLGHFFKIISFYLIYLALVNSGLTRPYQTLFRSLKDSEKKYQNAYAQMEQNVRKRTREIEAAAYEFESLFNSSQVGMMVLKGGRVFAKGNQRLADILGYATPEELEGISMQALHLTEDKFKEFGEQHYNRLHQGEVLQVEYELRRKDGSAVWCSLSGKALDKYQPGDLDKGVLWIIDDISNRKQAEQELKDTLSKLERSNDELAQFAYVASHDLQEPLRAIVGFLQLLESRYAGQLDEKGQQYILRSVNAGHRMQVLIQDLLTLSRIDTQGRPFESSNLNDIVKEVLNQFDRQVQQKRATIHVERLPNLMVDSKQIHVLFQNLLSNALKYNEHSAPIVSIGCKSLDNDYRFSVTDNGIGIDPKFFERIFIVFQRLHGRKEYSGTGVGLTLCKKIVERHGGTIWIDSKKGKGSTVFFTLPKKG